MSILDAMSTSITGLAAQSYALDNISGNIANTTTAGFKATNTAFADLLADSPSMRTMSGGGVGTTSRANVEIQGTVATTSTPTNLAISGDGFFIVKANTGSAATPSFTGDAMYTRRGDFSVDANGYLVNGAGNYLVGGSGSASTTTPLNLASTLTDPSALSSVAVSSTGVLTGTMQDGGLAKLGQITLAHFPSQGQLQGVDGGAYVATDTSGMPTYGLGDATLSAGAVEQSNANTADQFSKLIVTQQAYAANTKVLSATDEMMQDVIGMYV